MPLKVSIIGASSTVGEPLSPDSLILRCLQRVAGTEVHLVETKQADVVLMHPYRYPFTSTPAGALADAVAKRVRARSGVEAEGLLRKIYGIPKRTRILVISHENLDRRPWQAFGNLLLKTDLPRLTFWPQVLDPKGFRFPYWWNYVSWPEFSLTHNVKGTRFGTFYDLDILCEPQDLTEQMSMRLNKAVWLTKHLDFPRKAILDMVTQTTEVDLLQGVPWGGKLERLKDYRFCVTSENSTGYGYETEKLMEARIAGCIPIGYVQNPFSDFNQDAFFFNPPSETVSTLPPLLKERPELNGLLEYLGNSVV